MKLKYLDEIKFFDERDKKLVTKLLQDWADHLDKTYNLDIEVRKDDFKNNNIFFFTNCKDIIGDDNEKNLYKKNFLVNQRKDYGLLSFFLKKLSGMEFDYHLETCSTCGFSPLDIVSCFDNWGYYHFCPKCFKYIIVTFSPGLNSSFQSVIEHNNSLAVGEKVKRKEDELRDVA